MNNTEKTMDKHLAWATGGSMVPDAEFRKYYENGKAQTI